MSQRFGPYHVGETVGRGTFGKVKIAVHESTNTKVALKIIPRKILERDPRSKIKITREITILKVLRHPNIMRLYDVVKTTHDIVLILEYVSGGELFDYICRKGRLSEDVARHIFQQIVAALAYCHKYRVAHRDIKPENIMMEQGSTRIKIGDFGLSSVIYDGCFFETSCGTPNYASPEVVSGKLYAGPEADVWSCGVVLYAMIVGALPFDDSNVGRLFQKIQTAYYSLPSTLSHEVKDLLQRMLVVNPLERATMEQVMRHPWVTPAFPPPLLALHYDVILDTVRFGRLAQLDGEALDESVIEAVASRFHILPLEAYSIIATQERKILPSFSRSAVMSEGTIEWKRYPAAIFFEKQANVVDTKLWPTSLVIPPAEQALRDKEHDLHVSYLILLRTTQNRLYPEYLIPKAVRSDVAKSLILTMPMNSGYGSLNANSLCCTFVGPESAPKSYQPTHPKVNLNILRSQKEGDILIPSSLMTKSQSEHQATESVDSYMDGYNRIAEPRTLLCNPSSKHTLLGKLLGVVEHSMAMAKSIHSTWQLSTGKPHIGSSGSGALLQPLLKPLVDNAVINQTPSTEDETLLWPNSGSTITKDEVREREKLHPTGLKGNSSFSSTMTSDGLRYDIVSRLGNDFLRNGVLFSSSNSSTTLQCLYKAMEEEGFLWKVIQPFSFAAVIHPCVKLQVRIFKVTATEQIVDVKVSRQSGMRACDMATRLVERLRIKAIAHAETKLKESVTTQGLDFNTLGASMGDGKVHIVKK